MSLMCHVCFWASLFFFGSVSVALSSQKSQHHAPAVSPQLLATPTEDGVRRRSISSVDETLTNQNLTLILSPAPSITPTTTATTCDIVTCPTTTKEEGPGGSETRIQTDPGNKQTDVLWIFIYGNIYVFFSSKYSTSVSFFGSVLFES